MSTSLEEKEEKIRMFMECLAEESAKGVPIVVEGRRDIEALKAMGVNGQIISAKAYGKPLIEVVSKLEAYGFSEVILLLDFDRRGRELTRRLEEQLERAGIRPNLHFWNGLLELAHRDVKDIEGLASYMETLRCKIAKPPHQASSYRKRQG
ncbi:MAG: toprim domain-containing protein [Candidatus Bathyarchaeota archaeon]|nr:toprim domain-containing protein [Candidatus Bathyarchaeota archaeon]